MPMIVQTIYIKNLIISMSNNLALNYITCLIIEDTTGFRPISQISYAIKKKIYYTVNYRVCCL